MRCFKTMAVPPPPPALALPACHVVEHSGTRSLTSSGKWKPPVIQPKQLSSVELKEEVCKYVERKLRCVLQSWRKRNGKRERDNATNCVLWNR